MADRPKSESKTGVVRELSVVLPAFNEEANVERVVRECTAYLTDRIPDHELVAVDDGSRDRTGEILDRLVGPKR